MSKHTVLLAAILAFSNNAVLTTEMIEDELQPMFAGGVFVSDDKIRGVIGRMLTDQNVIDAFDKADAYPTGLIITAAMSDYIDSLTSEPYGEDETELERQARGFLSAMHEMLVTAPLFGGIETEYLINIKTGEAVGMFEAEAFFERGEILPLEDRESRCV